MFVKRNAWKSTQVKEIIKRGRWIYGGTVQSEVWIIKQNYFEGPTPMDEDPTPGYPPRDENGNTRLQTSYGAHPAAYIFLK